MDKAGSQDTKTLWVPMLEPEIVKQLRALAALGWGKKRIARELGIARNSVKRYLREGEDARSSGELAGHDGRKARGVAGAHVVGGERRSRLTPKAE